MTPERWQQVKGVLHTVLELPPSGRAAFLDRACDGDEPLRQEVESLLAADEQGRTSFLQSPPSLRLVKGTRLGDYGIQSLLGAGGMGEVYRARDLRLRRDVAIKVSPAFVASDPERLRRFEQEATAAAALNHPNAAGKCRLSGTCFKKEAAPSPEGAGLVQACCLSRWTAREILIARTQLRSLNRRSWFPARLH
jgi:serine/threonine protein kinase